MSRVAAIWAQGLDGVIGSNGQIPWRIPQDLEFFKKQTMGGAVIMGRKTWESIPEKFRPLPGRVNIVLTSQRNYQAPGALVVHHVTRAMEIAAHNPNVFVIGGDLVYRQCMWYVNRVIITEVDYTAKGDAYAPSLRPEDWTLAEESYWCRVDETPLSLQYRHMIYDRRIGS